MRKYETTPKNLFFSIEIVWLRSTRMRWNIGWRQMAREIATIKRCEMWNRLCRIKCLFSLGKKRKQRDERRMSNELKNAQTYFRQTNKGSKCLSSRVFFLRSFFAVKCRYSLPHSPSSFNSSSSSCFFRSSELWLWQPTFAIHFVGSMPCHRIGIALDTPKKCWRQIQRNSLTTLI